MKYISFVGMAWAALVGPVAASEKVIINADDDYAPYSYVDKGLHKGIYIDFIKKAAEKLAPTYEVVLQPAPWKRRLADLENDGSLAFLPPYQNKERKYIQTYSTPSYQENIVLFCTDDMMKKKS